jgi:hypothetical protein
MISLIGFCHYVQRQTTGQTKFLSKSKRQEAISISAMIFLDYDGKESAFWYAGYMLEWNVQIAFFISFCQLD